MFKWHRRVKSLPTYPWKFGCSATREAKRWPWTELFIIGLGVVPKLEFRSRLTLGFRFTLRRWPAGWLILTGENVSDRDSIDCWPTNDTSLFDFRPVNWLPRIDEPGPKWFPPLNQLLIKIILKGFDPESLINRASSKLLGNCWAFARERVQLRELHYSFLCSPCSEIISVPMMRHPTRKSERLDMLEGESAMN